MCERIEYEEGDHGDPWDDNALARALRQDALSGGADVPDQRVVSVSTTQLFQLNARAASQLATKPVWWRTIAAALEAAKPNAGKRPTTRRQRPHRCSPARPSSSQRGCGRDGQRGCALTVYARLSATLARVSGDWPAIMFSGPCLAGGTEMATRLGWNEACRWHVPQEGAASEFRGRIGPALVSWRHARLSVDLGYRGALWFPPLASGAWQQHTWAGWGRLRRAQIDSLRRVSGVLFVVDSQKARSVANVERLERLAADLHFVGRARSDVPVLFALNKRDLVGSDGGRVLPVDELRALLQWPICDYVETSARTGTGVDRAVERLLELVSTGPSG